MLRLINIKKMFTNNKSTKLVQTKQEKYTTNMPLVSKFSILFPVSILFIFFYSLSLLLLLLPFFLFFLYSFPLFFLFFPFFLFPLLFFSFPFSSPLPFSFLLLLCFSFCFFDVPLDKEFEEEEKIRSINHCTHGDDNSWIITCTILSS